MIRFAKPGLTGLDMVQKEEFLITAIYAISIFDKRPSIFRKVKHILSSERKLHKNYDRKGSVKKNLWS
jgi:hypothetical protein